MSTPRLIWPEGKRFAFTVFDDPDSQTLEASRSVYGFLEDLGLRTTKGVWPNPADLQLRSDPGETCGNPEYLDHVLELRDKGFEVGFHNATSHTSTREMTRQGLDRFASMFGEDPVTMANHYHADEGIYWAEDRLTGVHRLLYSALTLGRYRNRFQGHIESSPMFWGDLCRERIRYVRNFVFADINTLKACPMMPYHDPARPFVNAWYAGSEGAQAPSFVETINEAAQDRLAEERGCCIMYTHFGLGFYDQGKLLPRFRELMTRLSRLNGWFVPAGTLLQEIERQRGPHTITNHERTELERRWLIHKIRYGSA